jgi:cytosine/adenosine deaminase-related metal-dependent hydrolase
MRYISADYIFPIASKPIKNGVIAVDDDGTILDIALTPSKNQQIEFYKGIICPGFINTHCHLELSHLRSQVSERKGMTGFIKELLSKRFSFSEEEIQQAIADAETEMIKNGIVAVGDISNNNSTFKQKAKGNLLYHTFIEVFDLNPDKAEQVFENALQLESELSNIPLQRTTFHTPSQEGNKRSSITPHAPYTVSEKLFMMIHDHAVKNKSIISIHNQESEGENELFISGTGVMIDSFKAMGVNTDVLRKTGVNSLQSTLPLLPKEVKTLLVHNTYTSQDDITWAKDSRPKAQDLFWCTCPNANLYIENKLPNYQYFINEGARITIGTDSLASNWSLSVLDELKTITKHFPQIPLQTLLLWATKNGADFLGFDQLGTIEKGKKPGLNLLENTDQLKITQATKIINLL